VQQLDAEIAPVLLYCGTPDFGSHRIVITGVKDVVETSRHTKSTCELAAANREIRDDVAVQLRCFQSGPGTGGLQFYAQVEPAFGNRKRKICFDELRGRAY